MGSKINISEEKVKKLLKNLNVCNFQK